MREDVALGIIGLVLLLGWAVVLHAASEPKPIMLYKTQPLCDRPLEVLLPIKGPFYTTYSYSVWMCE